MSASSKDLLHLERKNPSLSAIESKLLVCGKSSSRLVQEPKPKPPEGAVLTSSIPKSRVVGKVKDFLGVISEANKKLDDDAKNNVKDCDIEALAGNESEYIEMDLMLGVADLHTPEAVAAAESAIAGHQPVLSLAPYQSDTESEDSDNDSSSDDDDDSDDSDADGDSDEDDNSDDDDDDDDDDSEDDGDDNRHRKSKRFKLSNNQFLAKPSGKRKCKKRSKIVELS